MMEKLDKIERAAVIVAVRQHQVQIENKVAQLQSDIQVKFETLEKLLTKVKSGNVDETLNRITKDLNGIKVEQNELREKVDALSSENINKGKKQTKSSATIISNMHQDERGRYTLVMRMTDNFLNKSRIREILGYNEANMEIISRSRLWSWRGHEETSVGKSKRTNASLR